MIAHPEHGLTSGLPYFLACGSLCLLAGLLALSTSRPAIATTALFLGFAAAGGAAAQLFERRFPPNHVSHLEAAQVDLADPVRLEGRILSNPVRIADGLQFDLEAASVESYRRVHPVTGKVRLRLQVGEDAESAALADSLHLLAEDRISTLTQLRRPRIYSNPGSFDFRRWMESVEDVCFVGTVKSPHLIEKLPPQASNRLNRLIQASRARLLSEIDQLFPPWSADGRSGAVLKAVLLGDRSSLDSETIENFRRTGLYHLLVISGLHVGLLAVIIGFALRLSPLREIPRAAVVLALLMMYAALVEQRAPTLRATLMIAAYLIGRTLYRQRALLNAVGFAALILLVFRPAWLFESGFQLSFSAALLIAGLAVPILERTTEPCRRALRDLDAVDRDASLIPWQAQFRLDVRDLAAFVGARLHTSRRFPRFAPALTTAAARVVMWTASMLLFSAVLQLGLLLPMAETFHRITFAGIGLNALAIPVMTALLALALPTLTLGTLIPSTAAWLGRPLAIVMKGLFALTDFSLPGWLSYRAPEPPLVISLGFALSVVAAGWSLGRSRRAAWISFLSATGLAFLISLHPFPPSLATGSLEVTALDAGGGDAIFVALPDRTTMLIDGGGSRFRQGREGAFRGRRWDPGEDIVSPYLWSRGISRIDILVLSHGHEDHLGGLLAVVRNFRVREFWHGPNPLTPAYLELLGELARRRVPVRKLRAGMQLERGAARVEVLWPPAGWPLSDRPSNDDSLVLKVSSGAARVLLPGDIGQMVEQTLADSGTDLHSLVLKVAHHGAATSSSLGFLERVAPSAALITAENRGPVSSLNPATLGRLRSVGARVFQTDAEGATTAVMRGPDLVVYSYRNHSAFRASATFSPGSPAGLAASSVR
ncbi:MAG: ComEC/Rec2 family competence protein [Acidobacteriia bacterium]|nr:ComEC/Rec2 family competence protein [Terriglobia bacterium]